MPRQGKGWTADEIDYLQENWGSISLDTIARNLNRTKNSILIKKNRLGLGGFLENGDYITFNQLLIALGYVSYAYKQTSWIKERGFPVKRKKINNEHFRIVYIDDWWKWAEKNQSFLDFTNFEENILGQEPPWVKAKRKRDIDRKYQYLKTPWTKAEDEQLKSLVSRQKYTYTEISKKLRRTEGAVIRRCNDLKLKDRPLKVSKQSRWSDCQLAKVLEMIKNGSDYEHMADAIGKSAKAIRGKIYILYGTEKLDKVRSKLC